MKDKQMIEEMAKVIDNDCPTCKNCDVLKRYKNYDCLNGICCSSIKKTEHLINLGYRKIPKDSVVLSREEYGSKLQDAYDNGVEFGKEWGSKETAEKIMLDLKQLLEGFIHKETGENLYIYKCKQFGVEIKEN